MGLYALVITSLLPKDISSNRGSIIADPFYEVVSADNFTGCGQLDEVSTLGPLIG